jgi:hypothetical protein
MNPSPDDIHNMVSEPLLSRRRSSVTHSKQSFLDTVIYDESERKPTSNSFLNATLLTDNSFQSHTQTHNFSRTYSIHDEEQKRYQKVAHKSNPIPPRFFTLRLNTTFRPPEEEITLTTRYLTKFLCFILIWWLHIIRLTVFSEFSKDTFSKSLQILLNLSAIYFLEILIYFVKIWTEYVKEKSLQGYTNTDL